jgi:putative lipoprotein
MRALLLVWTFSISGPPQAEHGDGDRWFAADKAQHFLASAAIFASGYAMMRGVQATRQQSLVAASVGTAIAGVTKETMDRRGGGEFCLKDLTWDAIGGVTVGVGFRHGP